MTFSETVITEINPFISEVSQKKSKLKRHFTRSQGGQPDDSGDSSDSEPESDREEGSSNSNHNREDNGNSNGNSNNNSNMNDGDGNNPPPNQNIGGINLQTLVTQIAQALAIV